MPTEVEWSASALQPSKTMDSTMLPSARLENLPERLAESVRSLRGGHTATNHPASDPVPR